MALIGEFQDRRATTTVTILNGASLSSAADLGGGNLIAISVPASWTAASMTFQASTDGTTYYNVYTDVGGELTATVDSSRHVVVYGDDYKSIRYLKLRSGTSGVPVNQVGDITITLVVGQEV